MTTRERLVATASLILCAALVAAVYFSEVFP